MGSLRTRFPSAYGATMVRMAKKKREPRIRKPNRYALIIEDVFDQHYTEGETQFEFTREEFVQFADKRGIVLPKNLGDLLYTFRFRVKLPKRILDTAGADQEWIIELAGRSVYRFRLAKMANIIPSPHMIATKIPD